MSALSKLKPVVRLSIVNPKSESGSAFGHGIAELCLGVKNLGSLNAAAKSMGMAYSKAWRIIKDTEAALVGNHSKSAKAEGSLTATPTGGAGTKVGLSDPVV